MIFANCSFIFFEERNHNWFTPTYWYIWRTNLSEWLCDRCSQSSIINFCEELEEVHLAWLLHMMVSLVHLSWFKGKIFLYPQRGEQMCRTDLHKIMPASILRFWLTMSDPSVWSIVSLNFTFSRFFRWSSKSLPIFPEAIHVMICFTSCIQQLSRSRLHLILGFICRCFLLILMNLMVIFGVDESDLESSARSNGPVVGPKHSSVEELTAVWIVFHHLFAV